MKKLMVMMAMMIAGSAAVADYAYLYWEVQPNMGDPWTYSGRAFDYAQLRVVDQGGNILAGVDPIGNYDGTGLGPVSKSWSTGEGPALTTEVPVFGQIKGDGFDYASALYGFVVEAYLDGDVLWTSGAKWYEDLVAGNHVWAGDPSAMSGDIAAVAFMIPEPTSGLLLLFGLAGLALRRRKNV